MALFTGQLERSQDWGWGWEEGHTEGGHRKDLNPGPLHQWSSVCLFSNNAQQVVL